MDYRVNDKGKYFTMRVTKHSVPVIARLQDSVVHGTVHLTLDNRLKDELNTEEKFIAVTDAQVWNATSTQMLYETAVLIVNKAQLVWIFPNEPTSQSDIHSTTDPEETPR